MAISEPTGPFDDNQRNEPGEEELRDEALGVGDEEDKLPDHGDDEEFAAEEELPLADTEARLPWLEGDDDEEDYGGYGGGQTIALAAAVLLVLGLIVGGIWWVSQGEPDAELVADGSTIKSEGPYKARPDKPGGKVFEGTGDSSFKVSEGQNAPARLGQADPKPAPGFKSLSDGEKGAKGQGAKPAGDPGASAGAATSGGVGVQVGAYSSRDAAEKGWSDLSQKHAALSGLRHRIIEGKADIGTVYRLQAVSGDAAAATALCARLKSSGLSCYVKP